MKKRWISALLAVVILLSGVFLASCCSGKAEEAPVTVDLTKMSNMMIYSLMYDILMKPEDYADQRMRLVGTYSPFKNPDTGLMEHTLIFYDVSYCCEVELRVNMKEEYQYPKDFPRDGNKMTVVGRFNVEEMDNKTICTLEDCEME